MHNIIVRMVNRIHRIFIYFAMLLLVAMTVIILINVFMRYVLNSGIHWAEEVSKLCMVWFTFIGTALGLKQGLHIRIHVLPKKLPALLDSVLNKLSDFISLFIGGVLFIFGIKLVQFTRHSIMPATQWPSFILYLILPFVAILIISESTMDLLGIQDNADSLDRSFAGQLVNE